MDYKAVREALFGRPIVGPNGQFQVGGPLGGHAGQLDTLYEMAPGTGDYRALMRALQAGKPRLTPDGLGGAKVGVDQNTLLGEAMTLAPAIGDVASIAKAGAAALGPLAAMMARRTDPVAGLAKYGKYQRGLIGSTGAKNADLNALKQAEAMKAQGIDADEIYAKTKWWLDHPDGRPRFEIDDSRSMPGHKLYSWGEREDAKRGNTVVMPRQKALLHHKLSAAYPDTKKIGVLGEPGRDGGSYDPELKNIRVGIEDNGAANRSTTLHELQHDIQSRENMARGGSPAEFKRSLFERRQKMNDQISAINDRMRGISREKDRIAKDYSGHFKPEDKVAEINKLDNVYHSLMDERSAIVKDLQKMEGPEGIGILEDAHNQYRALAGEAEARLVQDRMNMTMDERLANPFYKNFDVPLEQQIIKK